LKISSQTAISAKAIDDRSNETTLIVVGPKDEIIAIPRDNIAFVVMDRHAAKGYLAPGRLVGALASALCGAAKARSEQVADQMITLVSRRPANAFRGGAAHVHELSAEAC
jgi:hypothetical protein